MNKFFLNCTALLITLLLFFACTPQESLERRLNKFYTMLDNPALSNFQAGQLDAVVQHLDEQINGDEVFKSQYLKMKTHEGIDFFSTKQSVEFYYHSFLPKVNKTK